MNYGGRGEWIRRRHIARRVNKDLTDNSFFHVQILQTNISLFTCESIIASFWKTPEPIFDGKICMLMKKKKTLAQIFTHREKI